MSSRGARTPGERTRPLLPRVLLLPALLLLLASRPGAQPPPSVYFFDDIEGDTSGWTTYSLPGSNGNVWPVTVPFQAHSPTHAWGTLFAPNTRAVLLTPAIDLRSAVHPILRFWHFRAFEDIADHGTLYVVGDDGVPHIGTEYLGGSNWTEARFDLTQFAGNASLKVEFEIAMFSGHPGTWLVDDVEIFERPAPSAFGKILPANGTIVQPLTTSITWESSDDAESYEYCVDTTNNNTCDGTWTSTTDTQALLPTLNRNTTYWWQVRALNAAGATEANGGAWWSFTMGGSPAPFSKRAPGNGVMGQPVNPTLSWASSTGASGYEYCVDTTNNTSCDGAWTSTAGTTVELGGLAGATAYWWQVRARNMAGVVEADSGTWWTFKTAVRTNDFDGDGKTDVAVFRPSTGGWYALRSSTNNTTSFGVSWGLSTDVPMPGDYDGDGKTDPAIFRPSTGLWAILKSSTNYTSAMYVSWGLSTDVPAPADFDGDGKTDPAIYRPSTGLWAMLKSSNGYTSASYVSWGLSTDVPMPSDYDGDGKADPAVFRPSTGGWYALKSSTGYGSYLGVFWGLSTDVPVPGDYDGDGKTDPAVFRPSTGGWYVLHSHTNYTTSAGVTLGGSGDVPVPGDFDGDGRTDVAVFTPSTGRWSILKSVETVGLAHRWRLDEASGAVAIDATGDGTTDGTLGSGAQRIPGHIGPGALQFDAFDPNGYVTIPGSVAAFGTSDFTISFWMTKTPTSAYGTVVGNLGGFIGNSNFVQFYADDSTITLVIDENASARGYIRLDTPVLSLSDGQWHKITGVRAGPSLWLYVDGLLEATGTAADSVTASLAATGFDFTVGANDYERFHPQLNCGCRFDDVQIYSRALSARDIQSSTTEVNVSWGLSTDVPIGKRP